MNTSALTLSETLLALAEGLSCLCWNCSGHGIVFTPVSGEYEGGSGERQECKTCGGTGKHYPLRKTCRDLLRYPGVHADPSLNGVAALGYQPCCHGRGWVPVALGASTLEAALARCGIRLNWGAESGGWWVSAASMNGADARGEQYFYQPTDADSLTLAKLRATLEVARV